MTTVDEIMTAIERLTFDERAELARRMHGWEDDDWDRQIAADLDAGRLYDLIRSVDENFAAGRHGRPREIPDGPHLWEAAGGIAGARAADGSTQVPRLAR